MIGVDHHKQVARRAIAAVADDLTRLASLIHEQPELAFEEQIASKAVTRLCWETGFVGGRGIAGLETALRCTAGSGALNIAFCAEYDALPGIGHACGHNLIAGAAVGAAVGLAAVADDLDVTVTLLGTPAEERGGGKIELLKTGAFDDVHAALMAHPTATPFDVAAPALIAVSQLEIEYAGKASHASLAPHLGTNAADAMTVAQVAVALLRQQLPDGHQVHGIVTEGGAAANIIPSHTRAEFFIRASTIEELQQLGDRVVPCFEAGALATGCRCTVNAIGQAYADLICDGALTALYQANAEALGRRFEVPVGRGAGSTDMGNVSRMVPSIHPTFGLDCLPAVNHQPEFTAHTNTPAAHAAMISAATALAYTAIDAATDPSVRAHLLSSQRPDAELHV